MTPQGEATDGGVSGAAEGQDWQVAGWAGQRGTKVSEEEEEAAAEARQRAGGEPLGRGPQAWLPFPPCRAGSQMPRSVLRVQL